MPKIETEPQKESTDKKFEKLADEAIKEAISIVQKNFEQNSDPDNNLDFHNLRHTQAVIDRVSQILKAMQDGGVNISEKDLTLGKVAAAFHDTVQNWQEQKTLDPTSGIEKIMRQRAIGQNEKDSAGLVVNFMVSINQRERQNVFSAEDQEIMKCAIDSTVPGFDPVQKTVVQPNLTEKSHPVTIALALSDLGTAGINGGEAFVKEGSDLFCEENLDIKRALKSGRELTDGEKEFFRSRMIAWSKFQSIFAQGRKNLLEKEIATLPDNAKENLRQLFSKFDESIKTAAQKANERELMNFDQLLADFGY